MKRAIYKNLRFHSVSWLWESKLVLPQRSFQTLVNPQFSDHRYLAVISSINFTIVIFQPRPITIKSIWICHGDDTSVKESIFAKLCYISLLRYLVLFGNYCICLHLKRFTLGIWSANSSILIPWNRCQGVSSGNRKIKQSSEELLDFCAWRATEFTDTICSVTPISAQSEAIIWASSASWAIAPVILSVHNGLDVSSYEKDFQIPVFKKKLGYNNGSRLFVEQDDLKENYKSVNLLGLMANNGDNISHALVIDRKNYVLLAIYLREWLSTAKDPFVTTLWILSDSFTDRLTVVELREIMAWKCLCPDYLG